MGKLGKKTKKKFLNDSIDYNVSIVTPTIKSREKCLLLLAENISNQTYVSKIKEWIIVSGDSEWTDEEFEEMIKKIKKVVPENICINSALVTMEFMNKMNWQDICSEDDIDSIGNLRNISNKLANGDYIVCMDDDDYYPKTRVETAVTSLHNSNKLVAGCSNHLIYDVDLKNIYQFKKVHNNHSINNALAYKKEYINGNKYDSTKRNGEEKSFLNDFSAEMIQLDPIKTIVQIIHSNNTYNKRAILIQNAISSSKKQNMTKISSNSNLFIPRDILNKYYEALNISSKESEYDIVYYIGKDTVSWSPYDTMLNESRTSIKNLVECWTKNGFSVAVYGNFEENIINKTQADPNTGNYLNYLDFKCSTKYNILILWQESGINPMLSWNLHTKKLIIDLYDLYKIPNNLSNDLHKVDSIVVKSKFHATALSQVNKICDLKNKLIGIPSGIREDFTIPTYEKRNDYRFFWYASYTRGILEILAYLWPIIKEHKPEAELHLYPDIDDKLLLNNVDYDKFKSVLNKLKDQPGVIEHDTPTLETLVNECQISSYHLYLSKTPYEVDCVSIRESLNSGCIPIISTYNVFAERNGIKLQGDPTNKEDMKNIAKYIIEILDKQDEIKKLKSKMMGHDLNWQDISNKWQSVVFIQ